MAEIDNLVINVKVDGDTTKLNNIAKLITKTGDNAKTANSKVSTFGRSLKSLLTGAVMMRAVRFLGKAVSESLAYTENLNLFTVAMGEYAEEAKKYAETVSEVMGIDPAEWLKAQGTFNILATGFGVASDKAAIMSKNLTQLGYDLSSFYNISVNDAMLRLQSGMAGELEPLRRLGYDLSQARLQEEAHALGIDKKITAMNQAEKSMIRYHAIMSQVTVVQGDMSRTLESPANQVRILKAQFTQLTRATGNVFIPILNKLIPYLIAVAQVAREAAESLANFFGFTLPEVDYSSVNSSVGDIATDLDDANSTAKELKRTLMGFDEINRLNDTSNGTSGVGTGGGVGFDMEMLEYDFLGSRLTKDLDGVKETLSKVSDLAIAVGAVLAAWKIHTSLLPALSQFIADCKTGKIQLGKIASTAAGIGLIVIGVSLAFKAGEMLASGNVEDEFKGAMMATVSGLATAAGGAIMGGKLFGWKGAVAGAIIGITVSAVLTFKTYIEEQEDAARATYELTDNYKVMMKVLSESADIVNNSSTGISNLKNNISDLSTTAAEIGAAKNLATEIFNLSENSNKSAYEMELLRVKVELLNDMNIDGLKVSVNETTGTINETKESIYGVIEALEEQAKMAALQDILTQAYKDQYAAQYEMERALKLNTAAWEEYHSAYNQYNFYKHDENPFKAISEDARIAKARLEKASEALDASQVALDNATLAYNTQSDAISYYSEQLAIANGATSEWASQVTQSQSDTITAMADYGRNVVSAFDAGAKEISNSPEHKTFWDGVWNWLCNLVTDVFDMHSPSRVFFSFGENVMQGFWNGAQEIWQNLKSWWSKLELPSFKIKKPHIEWGTQDLPATDWKYKILSALGIPTQIPKLNVSWYAKGGFPNAGELFVAREAGAEMVGAIGRKTTVANNQQIVDGIYKGVYQAMRDSGGNNGGGQHIVVMLPNGDVLGESFVNWHNGVVKQTGNTPLLV